MVGPVRIETVDAGGTDMPPTGGCGGGTSVDCGWDRDCGEASAVSSCGGFVRLPARDGLWGGCVGDEFEAVGAFSGDASVVCFFLVRLFLVGGLSPAGQLLVSLTFRLCFVDVDADACDLRLCAACPAGAVFADVTGKGRFHTLPARSFPWSLRLPQTSSSQKRRWASCARTDWCARRTASRSVAWTWYQADAFVAVSQVEGGGGGGGGGSTGTCGGNGVADVPRSPAASSLCCCGEVAAVTATGAAEEDSTGDDSPWSMVTPDACVLLEDSVGGSLERSLVRPGQSTVLSGFPHGRPDEWVGRPHPPHFVSFGTQSSSDRDTSWCSVRCDTRSDRRGGVSRPIRSCHSRVCVSSVLESRTLLRPFPRGGASVRCESIHPSIHHRPCARSVHPTAQRRLVRGVFSLRCADTVGTVG